jgi:long-chain acyl-CoA synthetase
MSLLWSTIQQMAVRQPNEIAICDEHQSYSWYELVSWIMVARQDLEQVRHQVVALYADNSPEWIVTDIACQLVEVTLLPLPLFFSKQQCHHAMIEAGVSAVLHSPQTPFFTTPHLDADKILFLDSVGYALSQFSLPAVSLPKFTRKITFTSGSTGKAKGVCLSSVQQQIVAKSLISATAIKRERHLCLLPFSTLLENVAGIYAPLLSGGTVIALPQNKLGFNGNSGFDLNSLLKTIARTKPNSLIVIPELLLALVSAVKQGWPPPDSLTFIAVGGSKVSPLLLKQAKQCGLPVYEGYGLSECLSVVSLNTPKNNQQGSAGKLLEHVDVDIDDGEIIITGNSFLGYIGQTESWGKTSVATGDLGHIDEQGYLHIDGRKKNLLISSYGRNINPEWPESQLLANGLLKSCVVFGDAMPFCTALIYPRSEITSNDEIQQWIDTANQSLPDYAQIKQWHRLIEPLLAEQGFLTSNGRPVRNVIYQHYQNEIEYLYEETHVIF